MRRYGSWAEILGNENPKYTLGLGITVSTEARGGSTSTKKMRILVGDVQEHMGLLERPSKSVYTPPLLACGRRRCVVFGRSQYSIAKEYNFDN